MSTYTDLHTRRRENLTILRQPGASEDGITPQRVIFANPENIYEGTFKGKIEAVGVSFTSVDLTDATINGGKIKDATIYSDGREMSIADLTSNVSEISENLSGAIENITNAQISCGILDKRINDLISGESGVKNISAAVVNVVSGAVGNSLSSLSTELCGTVNYRFSSLESRLSNQMSEVSSLLSNALTSETSSRIDAFDTLSTHISSNEQIFDSFVNDTFAQHLSNFTKYVQDNKDTFDFLSNYMLSSIEHDRHYTIVDGFKEIPYRVKEFAVNVIDTGASDVEIKYGGAVIGYGTYIEGVDGSTKLRVSISTDDKIPSLINAIPGTYNADLKEGSANRQAVGGAYFYYITWLSTETDNTIKLEKIDQEYYDLVETSYNTTVGKIKNALVDNEGKFISGTIMFQQTGTEFDAFYNALSNGFVFNNAELSSTLSNDCQVKLNADYKTFSLGRDIKTQEIREIIDSRDDHNVFGHIVVTDVSVSQENIVKIPVTGINLTKYGIIKHNRAVELTEENSFYGTIANDLVISCDINNGNIFSVVQTKEKFAYPYYKPISVGPHELTDAIGYVIPGQVNTPINGGVFDKLSVQTETIDWSAEEIVLKTHECLSTAYNTYTCQEGIIGDYIVGWMSITVVKDVDTTWTVSLDGYDGIRGVEIKATYKVDTSLYAVVPEEGTYAFIAQSTPTNVLEGEEKTFPEASYAAVANGPKPVAGETEVDLALNPAEDTALQIQVPAKDSKYFDISREFIVAAKIASASQKVQVKLVDNGSKVEYQINGGKNEIWIPTNRWSTFKVVEVDQNKFLIEDLDNVYLRDEIAKINSSLAKEINYNKAQIDDLWKNIRGGLNYIDNLSVAANGYETVQLAFSANKDAGVNVPDLLREGFFYTIKTIDHNKRYSIEGIEVTHGDWFILKNSTPLSTVTSADIAVFDAQDFDNFKLSGDNSIVGTNRFNGNTALNGTNTISGTTVVDGALEISAKTTVIGDTAFSGNQTFKDGLLSSTKAYANDISIDNAYVQNANALSISIDDATVDSISIDSAVINKETVKDSSINNVEVTHYLSVDFDIVKNTKEEYLSSLHSVDQIKTINNIYRMVDEIEVEAGIKPDGLDYSIDLEDLVNIEIKERIIRNKQIDLFGSTIEEASNADSLKIFYITATVDTDLDTVVNALQEVLNRLKVAKYSLADKIRSIEKSIDALENDLQDSIDTVEGKADNALTSITRIDKATKALTANYSLVDSSNVSIITSLKQNDGKVTIEAKQLISSDVGKLDEFAYAMADELKRHAADNYLPLSSGKMEGNLSIDATKSFYVGDSNKMFIGDNTLCSMLSNEITLSTSTAYSNLSSELSTNFNFTYDNDNNVLCVTVAGNTKTVPTAKFTEARMLDSVNVIYDAGKPFLQLKFKTDVVGSYTVVSVDLTELMPLYNGADGIDIQYQDNKYQVSADSSICRRNDISNITVTNSITEGYILTSLTQDKGKISYAQKQLSTSHVAGLENYVKTAIDNSELDLREFTSTLSGNAGVISSLCSTVDAKIQSLDFDDPGFYEAGKIKTLTYLNEVDGKVSATTKVLDYHEIDGLSTAIDNKFNKTGGAIDGSLSVTESILVNGAVSMTSGPNGGVAIGRNAVLSNEEAFVWSGAHDEPTTYKDHGKHTFNINPQNGLSGFYVGEESLHDTLSELSGTSETKISAIYSTVLSALNKGGIEGKEISEITLANVISCVYFLGQSLRDIKTIIEG